MRYKRILAVLLCLLLCLSGCGPKQPQVDNTQVYLASYTQNKTALEQASALTMTASYKLTRTVGGHSYTQGYDANIACTGYGTENLTASVTQVLKYGAYEKDYAEFFSGGTAYCRTDDYTFSSAMSAEEFMARYLPPVLVHAELYQAVTSHAVENSNVLVFSGATALESWVTAEPAQLVSASATVTLDANGTLKETVYVADFIAGGLPCRIEAAVSATASVAPDPLLPPENSTPIDCFDAPKLLLQAVGSIFSADSVSANAQETLICSAASLVQTTQRTIDFLSLDGAFMAKSDYTATVTNYTGIPATSTMTETFRDGSYSYAVNGGEPVVQTDVTAQKMRTDCEDLLLAGLFTPAYIQNAQLTDTGDFLYLHFAGNDSFVNALCSWIYSGIGADLDSFASAVSTDDAFGWLAIDKRTGLPTAIGQSLKRTHVIEHVSYPLTYEYSQSLLLSGDEAHLNITGSLASEAAPQVSPTPLLYEVTDANGHRMWLFGTIHVGDAATAYLPQSLTDALLGSDALALEVNAEAFEQRLETDTALRQQLAAGYYYTDGSVTAQYLDASLYEKAAMMLRISGDYGYATQRMKPALWENAIHNFLLQQSYGLTPSKGVERRLLKLASQSGLPVLDIEDPLTHALLTTEYSPALQAYLLKGALEQTVSQYAAETNDLYTLWCQGDEAALTAAIQEDISQLTEEEIGLYNELNAALITERNALMLEKATEYLESDQTVFFAVGLAHVLGDDGLVAALRNAGYTVRIVTY